MPSIPASRWFLVLAVLLASPVRASVHRVPQDQVTITAALATASPGDTVLVEAGVYSPATNAETFPLVLATNDVTLLGAGAEQTVLDAMGTGSVLVSSAASGGRVSGFTLTGGIAAQGGGVQILAGSPELDHDRFLGNGASVGGAAVSAHGSATPWIHHNVFLDSHSTSAADVHALRLNAKVGGTFEHNLVSASDGNGLLTVDSVTTEIRNNIFYRNGIPDPPRGRGICWISDLPAHVHHNLFFENQVAALFWSAGGGDYDAAAANAFAPDDDVFANLESDPLFVDAPGGDFQLLAGSPAVDAGDPQSPADPDGTRADIGPFATTQVTGAPAAGLFPGLSVGPNPAREGTAIRFSLARPRQVTIEVLDASGRQIGRLGHGVRGAGDHVLRWDARDSDGRRVAAGLYFVSLRMDGTRHTRRVVVVR
jgi:hypothetical protein